MSKKQITGVGIAVLLIAIYFGVKFYASNVAEKMVNEAIVKVANGEDDRAIRDYNKAIELKPDCAEAYNNRGNAYEKKGEYERAKEDYRKACELGYKPACGY